MAVGWASRTEARYIVHIGCCDSGGDSRRVGKLHAPALALLFGSLFLGCWVRRTWWDLEARVTSHPAPSQCLRRLVSWYWCLDWGTHSAADPPFSEKAVCLDFHSSITALCLKWLSPGWVTHSYFVDGSFSHGSSVSDSPAVHQSKCFPSHLKLAGWWLWPYHQNASLVEMLGTICKASCR